MGASYTYIGMVCFGMAPAGGSSYISSMLAVLLLVNFWRGPLITLFLFDLTSDWTGVLMLEPRAPCGFGWLL